MTELSFDIQSTSFPSVTGTDCRLVLEAGETHLAIMIIQVSSNRILGLRYYQFPANEAAGAYEQVMKDDKLVSAFGGDQVDIFFHTRESVLVPEALYAGNGGERILSMVHGDLHTGIALEDSIVGLDIRNLYRIHGEIVNTLHRKFPGARFRHESTALLQLLKEKQDTLPPDHLFLQVYPNTVLVTVIRNRECQLVQSYPYDIPEDVSYHLLNTTEQLGLDPDSIPVKVSGLIDPASPLYLELLKYFRNLETYPAGNCLSMDEAFDTHPAHFFTPQTILAACA